MSTNTVPFDYGMFTEYGNRAVDVIVDKAITLNQTWPHVYAELQALQLRDYAMFQECMDTEVRSQVYHRVGFSTHFYF
jgi:hypothetical protein